MDTKVHEIAERIYRLSTFVSGVAGPMGLTFNQFLIDAEEPLLFHCGQRTLFPSISQAAARVMDVSRIRWITFSHVEADECGSLNDWLRVAPHATPAHGLVGCNIWLNDAADRPPRVLGNGEVLDLGGRKVRRIDTPHLPHCWDAGLLYEEVTGTLFCSDLFTHPGDAPALTEGDIVGPALAVEQMLPFTSLTAKAAPTVRMLAEMRPRQLAVMHGSSLAAGVDRALESLAEYYEKRLRASLEA